MMALKAGLLLISQNSENQNRRPALNGGSCYQLQKGLFFHELDGN